MPDDFCSHPRAMRWWGWGRDDERPHLPGAPVLQAFLRDELGMRKPSATPPRPLADVLAALPAPALGDEVLNALREAVGARFCSTHPELRLLHCMGKSYRDLVRIRQGLVSDAPDAVLCPADADQVAAILDLAARHDVAVVPFGGGSSVVAGVEALRGTHAAVISLDLHRMSRLLRVDPHSRVAEAEAGIFGPELEQALGREGFTLGHFPQSFRFSTLGGWVATRSAGQNSTRYGKIEDMVVGLEVVTPRGRFNPRPVPARASGPDLRELFVGSEGTLGVITRATVRIQPVHATEACHAYLFPAFERGVATVRRLMQAGLPASVLRLSDASETRTLMRLGGRVGWKRLLERVGSWALRWRGFRPGSVCVMLVGFEGIAANVRDHLARTCRLARENGGIGLGAGPGRRWAATRFDHPYLRDDLLNWGVMVDTLETAALWSALPDLYAAVGSAIRGTLGERGVVNCHVSHAYTDGASLYFTFLAPQEAGRELAQWDRVKSAATDAILRAGGALSHHHGVGADHRRWMAEEWGAAGLDAMRAVKDRVDPAGILNPGKLLP